MYNKHYVQRDYIELLYYVIISTTPLECYDVTEYILQNIPIKMGKNGRRKEKYNNKRKT